LTVLAEIVHVVGGTVFNHAIQPHRYDPSLDRAQSRETASRRIGGMDDYVLKDVGVSRETALREAAKPFWRR